MNQIQLIAGDREWNGSYKIESGNVVVSSAYGAEREPIADEGQAETVALQIFERIVKRRHPGTVTEKFRPGRPYAARR